MSKLIPMVVFLVLSIFALTTDASTCKRMSHPLAYKPKVVLIHGFTCGGWCWYKVKLYLELSGYNVTALDLKASGVDRKNISEVETFDQYNEPLDRFMKSLSAHEKVVVVGHSAGGVSVTKTIIDHPEKVIVAIYVAATMLKSGYLTCQDLQIGTPNFNKSKCNVSCPKLPEPSCFEKEISRPTEIPLKDRTEDFVLGALLARPGPYRAILTSNFTKAIKKSSRVDKVPRVYVKTLFDQTLLPKQQADMIKLWPPCEIIELNNDHDVPSTKPQILSALIANATMYTM